MNEKKKFGLETIVAYHISSPTFAVSRISSIISFFFFDQIFFHQIQFNNSIQTPFQFTLTSDLYHHFNSSSPIHDFISPHKKP
ncbi:hypothetical protein QVD17_18592 [Tagetes erecta]|uniref:Uncharacterized protein n=1 Tax=Tagetes erecta TaxID=13708 RepID=A0AAD8KIE4_TARER|nr:hypothetical protein QVD17_18592 [Tagetes erecta]